ncbi:unnamed protein product [Adineta steineri]|uniref:EGF-like domain-containing protein n=1 Tax=Adineta steineri TaxID=433720 RepID=A0A818FQH7_9BILA|nr:unnamed protein product [Adineta steineri]
MIIIKFILRTTCINSSVDDLTTNSLLEQHKNNFTSSNKLVNRISSQIKSCSKWNRIGETIVGKELNTHLNDLESITIIGIDTLYVVDRYNDKTRLQIFSNGSLVGRTLWNGLDSIVLIDENGTFYTSSHDGNIEHWSENRKEGKKINCQCNQCSRIWFDSEKQEFYIVERFRSRIIKCNINTNTTITIAGTIDIDGFSNKTLSYPYALYINDVKDIYITDVNNHRIQKWKQNATIGITIAGQTRKIDQSNTTLHRPYDIIVDTNDFIYIADMINHRILRWKEGESQGEIICGITGQSGNSTLHLNRPKSLAFGFEGNLYVADVGNKRVQRFTIDNSACLLPESESVGDHWSFLRQKFYASKVEQENSTKLGFGYNPLKDSSVCYTETCQRRDFGLPIFKFRYSIPLKGLCTNKLIPENVKVNCISSQDNNIETQIISTLYDLKENTKKAVDFSTSSILNRKYADSSFSYAYSREIHSMIDMLIKDNSTILLTSVNVTSTYLSIVESNSELSDEFRSVIEHIPCCDFNETVEKYIREFLIGYFGYTYIKDVQLGGIIKQKIIITHNDRIRLEQNGFNTSNETWLKDIAKNIFSFQKKLNQTKTHDQILINTFNRYSTKSNVMILGGKTSIQSLKDWYKSVPHSPIVMKIGISSISDLLTTHHFPTDSYINQKAILIQSVVDRYLSNPIYCYNQCTDTEHGICVDSGHFQFGVCKCKSGWTGFDCATPIYHYIDTVHSNISPIWNTKAGKNSNLTSIGYGKGQMPPNETISNIIDRNIYTKYTSFGSSSADVISRRSGLNTGFYMILNTSICIVTGFQFTTAISQPKRDPIMITLEGSNADNSSLTFGTSWTLIYNGSSGLEIDPGRGKVGSLQILNNSQPYRSYRMLVISKREIESGVHYSEFALYGHSCLPETHIQTRNIMTQTTSAYMRVTNDYPQPLILTTSTNMNMKDTFPSQTIEAGRTSPMSYISTGTEMCQSYFDIAYGSSTIKINMGQNKYVTDANLFGLKGQTEALLAPTKPFSKDTDYTFYFFGGPDVLPPLINSLIDANLPAITAYVSTNQFYFNLTNDIKLTIRQLDLTLQSIRCSYATLSPIHHQENNLQWNINMILNLNGKIFGSITYHYMSMDFNITLSNASMLTQAIVNISDLQVLSCTITQLFSLHGTS